jgi:hypothetical protein
VNGITDIARESQERGIRIDVSQVHVAVYLNRELDVRYWCGRRQDGAVDVVQCRPMPLCPITKMVQTARINDVKILLVDHASQSTIPTPIQVNVLLQNLHLSTPSFPVGGSPVDLFIQQRECRRALCLGKTVVIAIFVGVPRPSWVVLGCIIADCFGCKGHRRWRYADCIFACCLYPANRENCK